MHIVRSTSCGMHAHRTSSNRRPKNFARMQMRVTHTFVSFLPSITRKHKRSAHTHLASPRLHLHMRMTNMSVCSAHISQSEITRSRIQACCTPGVAALVTGREPRPDQGPWSRKTVIRQNASPAFRVCFCCAAGSCVGSASWPTDLVYHRDRGKFY